MASHSIVDEFDLETPSVSMPSGTNGAHTNGAATQAQTPEHGEEVDELAGAGGESESYGEESLFGAVLPESAADAENHQSVNSPVRGPVSTTASSGSESVVEDEESFFEQLEGFDEHARTTESNAAADTEPLIEAYYADPQGNEEFFGALLPALVPLAKTILPTVASAVAQQGISTLKPRVKNIVHRLASLGFRAANLRSETDSGDGAAIEVDESTIATLEHDMSVLEVIIGKDDRVQVMNTTRVPWNRICHLNILTTTGKRYLGTGFLVGRRTVITAGHCVHIANEGGWVRQIEVSPGRNGNAKPYDTYTATAFRSVRGWVVNRQRNYDYGAIILPRSVNLSPAIGAFGFANYTDTFLMNKRLNLAGYPGDKPAGTMWFHAMRAKMLTARTIIYDIDTMGGQSGSPVWVRLADGRRIAVGIHTNGSLNGNSATRISKPVFDNLKRWRKEGGE